jgi:hypothetical protein
LLIIYYFRGNFQGQKLQAMKSILITGANIVNEGRISPGDILVKEGLIAKIGSDLRSEQADIHIDATGKYIFPGVIDDQVHFREPGLTHKGEIYTEAKAGVAGGTTTYMEMPNTVPQSTTIELLEQKYMRASEVSLANYSFFFGATNDNLDELIQVNPKTICGVKVFQGSSTGNMLVDNPEVLEKIFSQSKKAWRSFTKFFIYPQIYCLVIVVFYIIKHTRLVCVVDKISKDTVFDRLKVTVKRFSNCTTDIRYHRHIWNNRRNQVCCILTPGSVAAVDKNQIAIPYCLFV